MRISFRASNLSALRWAVCAGQYTAVAAKQNEEALATALQWCHCQQRHQPEMTDEEHALAA